MGAAGCDRLHQAAALYEGVRGCRATAYPVIHGGGVPPGAGLLRGAQRTYRGEDCPGGTDRGAYAGRTPCIGGAEIVLECRKMYRDRFGPAEFLEKELIDAWYPEKDFHYLYICAIEKVYVRE